MSNEVNLLRSKQQNKSSQRNYVTLVRLIAAVCLFIVILVAIILFILQNLSPLGDLQRKESALLHNLQAFHVKEIQEYLINDRVLHIQTILQSRSAYDSLIIRLFGDLPSDTSIQSLAIDKGNISFTLSSSSLLSLGQSLDKYLELTNGKKIFKTIVIDSLIANEKTGKFSLEIHGGLL